MAKKNLQDSVVRALDFRGQLTAVPPWTAPTAREQGRAGCVSPMAVHGEQFGIDYGTTSIRT
jgi:hypothetical protein